MNRKKQFRNCKNILKITLTLLVFAVFHTTIVLAQTHTITGKVINSDNNQPLARASVTVHNPANNTIISGGYSDKNGNFSIKINAGNYYVSVKFVGYETTTIRNISLTSSDLTFDCKNILLKLSSVMQDEVIVSTQREAIEVGLDRKVFNIEQDASNIGGSALDVLANIPSVAVDQDDNVSLRGNSNVKILVDGKVSNMTASEALEQIPSAMVSSIELITNPGARYEADGTAGMINIVTTKEREDGFNAMVNLAGSMSQAGDPGINGSISANLNTGKWNFFANFGGNFRNRTGTSERNRILYKDGMLSQTLFQESDDDGGGRGFRGKVGTDYNFSKSDILTYAFTFGGFKRVGIDKSEYWVSDPTVNTPFTEHYSRSEENKSPLGQNIEHILSYKHNFEAKGHELFVDLIYNNFKREGIEYYDQTDYITDIFTRQQNIANMDSRNITAQVDYAQPIGTNFKLEAGGKYSNRTNDIDNHLDDWQNDAWVVSNSVNQFEFGEQILAAYLTASTEVFDILKLNVGVRSETTMIDFDAILQPESSFSDNYTMFFPSVYLGYDLNINHMFTANFSSRMRRPNYWNLNPMIDYDDPLNLRQGNPGLRPESHYNFELGYLMNYDRSTFTATVFHRYSTDGIEMYKKVLGGDTTLAQPMNISTSSRTGFEFIYMYQIFDNWKADANYSLYSYTLDATNIGAEEKTAYNWTARFNTQASFFDKFLDFTLTASVRSKTLRAQGESKGNWNMDAAFRFNFSRSLSLSLRFRDIFNSRQWEFYEDIPGVLYSEMKSKRNSRGVTLGISYRINDYKQKKERTVDDGRMSSESE